MSRYTRRWFRWQWHQLKDRKAIRAAREQRVLDEIADEQWYAGLEGGRLVPRTINDTALAAAHRPLTPRELEQQGYVRNKDTRWWEKHDPH